jgi:hypothetical protein
MESKDEERTLAPDHSPGDTAVSKSLAVAVPKKMIL